MSEHNPLIPAGYDIAWSLIAFVTFALTVVAIVSLMRVARLMMTTQALVWVVVVLFVPILGPLSWLFVGRRSVSASSEPRGR